MNEIAKITNDLEYLFIKKIIQGLRDEEISIDQSKKFAVDFVKIEPFSSIEDAKNKIIVFVNKYSYFKEMNDFMNAYHEERKISEVIGKMRKDMQSNEIDEALKVATDKSNG